MYLGKPRGLPLYEGVDWNILSKTDYLSSIRLPLYEGVDWNIFYILLFLASSSLPLYEGVDWNRLLEKSHQDVKVSLFTREWIEIKTFLSIKCRQPVSLFTREWIEIVL